MPQVELYENKVLRDPELPVQINTNIWRPLETLRKADATGFPCHWHEHLELHYIVSGEADFRLNQTVYPVVAGDFIIINPNELHAADCTRGPYYSRVAIFDIGDLSPETANRNYLFHSLVKGDKTADQLTERLIREWETQQTGYKPLCKALVIELLVHLCRHHVREVLDQQGGAKRRRNLERLNVVLCYIEEHYAQPITNAQLAALICLSEDRFGHLFRENVGKSPVQYLNELRLKRAFGLLKSSEYTVTEVAAIVGFQDYNHFGRLFRKHYGCTPYEVRSGKSQLKNSEIV